MYCYLCSCIFLPGNGAFFVSYVITSALVGTGFELIRIPELLEYIVRRMFARTTVQKKKAMEKVRFGCILCTACARACACACYMWCRCLCTHVCGHVSA